MPPGGSRWQKGLLPLDAEQSGDKNLYRVSTAVVRAHEAFNFPGGIIASLSIPWGFNKGDNDLGGYHLVWPRDLVESAGGLLAAGGGEEVRRVLCYLQATQEADGHWAQNMWLDGSPYWNGIQMDETALPILLLDLARREGALAAADGDRFWPMAREAAAYLVRNGPVSPQDRWEEDPGYSPFTVAAEIAALLAAADLAELQHEPSIATYLRETADVWYASIDRWMYVTGTDWCREFQVAGYYVRIAPVETEEGVSRMQQSIPVKNVGPGQGESLACHLVSPDALALVRFGLRAADDPRILDTLKVIDALLKVETPQGPAWHRYNGDGYGEHEDGEPFDGTGIGRAWPLLTGERAHLRTGGGPGRRGEAAAEGAGILCRRRRAAPRADLGRPGCSGAGAVFRPTLRFGHAPRLGPCRIPEAAALPARRAGLRPAAANGPALSGGPNRKPLPGVALQPQDPLPAGRQNSAHRDAGSGGHPLER